MVKCFQPTCNRNKQIKKVWLLKCGATDDKSITKANASTVKIKCKKLLAKNGFRLNELGAFSNSSKPHWNICSNKALLIHHHHHSLLRHFWSYCKPGLSLIHSSCQSLCSDLEPRDCFNWKWNSCIEEWYWTCRRNIRFLQLLNKWG